MNSGSVICPRSSVNSGGSPDRAASSAIASRSASSGMPSSSWARLNASVSGSVTTPPKSLMTALITRAGSRRSGRRRCALRGASGRTRRRAAARRARASSRSGPRRCRGRGTRRRSRSTARCRRGSGGRPRRSWSRGGPRRPERARSGASDAPQVASSAWCCALAGRTVAIATPVPSSNQAPTARVSEIRSQSGLPHECPRWPSPRSGRSRPPARTVPRTRQSCS